MMLKTTLFGVVLMVLATILQTTWIQAIAIFSVVPDLPMIILVFLAFSTPKPASQIVGFLSGLLYDSISIIPLGTSSLLRVSVAFLFNSFADKFYFDKILMPVVFCSAGVLLKALYMELMQAVFKDLNFLSYSLFSATLWLEVAYTAALAPILFFIFRLINNGLSRNRKKDV